ncbi:MAG: inorganic phosphate transporter [Chitinophagaceae bacterium]|nr:inorganic phosphate transporter [Chitinophagaceae bacterium]
MTFFLFLVVILFLLAITDLIVGVSNDAVNFLNSAIGSRVARFRTIIIIAALGVILGSIFSSGIMEIARKGIFHPQYFTFDKIMWIFLAVMLTDILLLDVFNSLGLPTSTTVSIIFELLGASLVTGLIISYDKAEPVSEVMKYINAESVVSIITGIFLSIIIAFSVGMIVQYLCRLLFTFNYEEKLNRFGAIFAGLGLTAITYFLLIKGLKGTSLLTPEKTNWINNNTFLILGVLFVTGTIICGILQRFAKINPLKIVVLMGTFSLAMAFAGNDLVNFIGVPITGFLSFQNWQSSGLPAKEMTQEFLASSDVIVPNYMLLIAGAIMALTLWLSSKAKKVTETEVNLGSQVDGEERFKPNAISRRIVKTSMLMGDFFALFVPRSVATKYNLSFEKNKLKQATVIHDKPAFDLVRAAANLVIASSLIAFATSMKLPLSTTYVSFMVAMGTSLADRAWGAESAVYRVAGVLSVIGGWFITAIIAFTVAALFALILNKGGIAGTIILLILVSIFLVSSQIAFAKKEKNNRAKTKRLDLLQDSDKDIMSSNKKMITDTLTEIGTQYNAILEALNNSDKAALNEAYVQLNELDEYGYKLRAQSIRYMKGLNTEDKKTAEVLLYSTDLLQDIVDSANNLGDECLHYIQNLHKRPNKEFLEVTEELRKRMSAFIDLVSNSLQSNNYAEFEKIKVARDSVRLYINEQLDLQVSRIQVDKPGVKQSILQTSILLQSRDILAVTLRILKMYRKYLHKPVSPSPGS